MSDSSDYGKEADENTVCDNANILVNKDYIYIFEKTALLR